MQLRKILLYFTLFWGSGFACNPNRNVVEVELSDTTEVEEATEEKNLEIDPLEKDSYNKEVYLDSILEPGDWVEYLDKGLMRFYTFRDIQPWLDHLYKKMGQPDSTQGNSDKDNRSFYWHNRNLFNQFNISVLCDVRYDFIGYANVVLNFLDKDLQLIEDENFLNSIRRQIKNLVFTQAWIRGYSLEGNLYESLGKYPYIQNDGWNVYPENFDSVMTLIAQDKRISTNWENISVRCIIDSSGKISRWKLKNDFKDELEIQRQLEPYKKLFCYPIKYSLNHKGLKIPYSVKFNLYNISTQKPEAKKRLDEVISNLNQGKYNDQNVEDGIFITEISSSGKAIYYRKDNPGFNAVIAEVPTGNKMYSFFFDLEILKLYTIQRTHQTWIVRQTYDVRKDLGYGTLDIDDLDKDGFADLIISSGRNMNGNRWSDIFVYHPEKDSFLLAAENFCCVDGGFFRMDSLHHSNQNYYLTHYGGSWYMPQTTSIYRWHNKTLQPEVIFGVELLHKNMGRLDYPIFFIQKNINGKMQTIKQINTAAGAQFAAEAKRLQKEILDQYFPH